LSTPGSNPFDALFATPQQVESHPDPDLLDCTTLLATSSLKQARSEAKKAAHQKRVSFQDTIENSSAQVERSDLDNVIALLERSRAYQSQNDQLKRSKSTPDAHALPNQSSTPAPSAPRAPTAEARYLRNPNPRPNAFYNWYAANVAELNANAQAKAYAEAAEAKAARDPNVTLERKPAVRKASLPTVTSNPQVHTRGSSTPTASVASPSKKEEVKKPSVSDIEKAKEAEAIAAAAEQARLIRRYDSLASLSSIRADFLNAQATSSPHATPSAEEPAEMEVSDSTAVDAPVSPNTATQPTNPKFYEETVLRLLERLDGVESDGDDVIRFTRRSLARELADELEAIDKAKVEREDEQGVSGQEKKNDWESTPVTAGVNVQVEIVETVDEVKKEVLESTQLEAKELIEESQVPEEVISRPVLESDTAQVPHSIVEDSSEDGAQVPGAQVASIPPPADSEEVAEEPINEEGRTEEDQTLSTTAPVDSLPVGIAETQPEPVSVQAEASVEEPAHTFPPRASEVDLDPNSNPLSSEIPVISSGVDAPALNLSTSSSSSAPSSDSQSAGSSPVEADASPHQALTELGSDIVVLTDDDDSHQSDVSEDKVHDEDVGTFEVL